MKTQYTKKHLMVPASQIMFFLRSFIVFVITLRFGWLEGQNQHCTGVTLGSEQF